MTTQKRKPTVVDKNEKPHDQAQEQTDQRERFFVEDEYTGRVESDLLRVKEALGIDDDDFCKGILDQLYGATGLYHYGDTDFSYALSILKDINFVDKTHVTLVIEDIRCQLAEKRLLEKAGEPIKHDVLPDDLAWAHYYGRDISTLPKRRMIIDNQPMLDFRLRWYCRLVQKRTELLDATNRYLAMVALLNNGEKVSVVGRRRAIGNDTRQVANGKTLMTMKGLPEMNSTGARKSNGHAST